MGRDGKLVPWVLVFLLKNSKNPGETYMPQGGHGHGRGPGPTCFVANK